MIFVFGQSSFLWDQGTTGLPSCYKLGLTAVVLSSKFGAGLVRIFSVVQDYILLWVWAFFILSILFDRLRG